MVGILNASGGVIDGVVGQTGGVGLEAGVPKEVMQSLGDPNNNLQNTAGSQLCEDVENSQLYMATSAAGGSAWSQLSK